MSSHTENGGKGDNAHQYQAGDSTHRDEDRWKFRAPYRIHEDADGASTSGWRGRCHCGRIEYQLSREGRCQQVLPPHDVPAAARGGLSRGEAARNGRRRLSHPGPLQRAAIFHKEDINFTRGHHDLGWYDPTAKSTEHHLPCKVQARTRTPIMDEGRNMILLFPTLVEGINTARGREASRPRSHMFYPQRGVDFGGRVKKFKGLQDQSPLVDDDGNEIEGEGRQGGEDK